MNSKQYNVAVEKVPHDWQHEPALVQRFNALLLISIFQFFYALFGYAMVIGNYLEGNKNPSSAEDFINLAQTYVYMSVLTIIAAIILRIRLNGERTVTQVKVYTALVGIDMVAWIARSVFDLKGQLDKDATVSIYLATAIAFTGFLMLVGIIEGVRVIIEASKQRYSLINDGNGEASHSHRASLAFYPLRYIAILQLAYTILCGFLRIFVSARNGDDFGVLILLTPAAGLCTIIAVILIFINRIGKASLTYYAILITIDMITGVMRVIGGLIYEMVYLKREQDTVKQEQEFLLFVAIATVIPLFYWMLGISTAYRTRVHIEMDTNITSELDRVFGI